jgi:methionyl-tRNA synthetase
MKWNSARNTSNVHEGHTIGKDELLFSRIDDQEIEVQLEKLKRTKAGNAPVMEAREIKPETSFDDFSKMDIRTATILEAEVVPKTDKLLKLLLDTGVDKRTVVSGIAQYYKPEDIIGHKVCLLANLAPRKIKGIESKGMILMAENTKGELSFVSPVKNEIENGSIVK